MPFYVCVDAGTARIKASLMDDAGDLLFIKSKATPLIRPFAGASEIDMQALWEGLCALLQELKEAAPVHWASIAGLCVCGQGDGLWPLDREGRPLGNAILWNDRRAGGIERDHALMTLAVSERSAPLFPGAYPAILYDMKRREPERYARVAHVLHCKDYLNFRLTGEIASDYTDQSAAGLDLVSRSYARSLFRQLDIEEKMAALPPLRESASLLGGVSAQAGRASGLPVGLPVVTGCMDTAATALGVGMARPGDGCIILGTTLCCERLIAPAELDMWDTRGSTLISLLPDTYMRIMAASGGMRTLEWAFQTVGGGLPRETAEAELLARPAPLGGPLFHPYLYGERAPFRESAASGGFYGLRAEHDRLDMLRAVYEGLALSALDCMSALPEGEGRVYLCGGGAKSTLLRQLTADALARRAYAPHCGEPGLRGAGILAKIAFTGKADIPLPEGEWVEPDAENSRMLHAQYEEYIALRTALLPYWRGRAEKQP